MKAFHLEPGMTTMGGVFYPTGYMVLMFPNEKAARDAEMLLEDNGIAGESVSLLTPEVFQEEIARTVDDSASVDEEMRDLLAALSD